MQSMSCFTNCSYQKLDFMVKLSNGCIKLVNETKICWKKKLKIRGRYEYIVLNN